MPISISEIRAKFPMYENVPDDQLVIGLHRKFYADVPFKDFNSQIVYDKKANATEGMSTLDKVRAGFGKAVVDTGRGIGQMVGAVSRDDVAESRKLDASLDATTAGRVGNFAGNLAMALPTVAVPGAATLRGAAAIGAAQGFIQPSTSATETLQNTGLGAAAGAGGVAAGRALSSAYQGLKAFMAPFTQSGREKIAGNTILRFADDPAKVLAAKGGRTATGALPTIAEETGDAGMARLQDAARSMDPQIAGRIDARLAENNAARVAKLEDLAGNEARRKAADAARKSATTAAYQKATQATYTADAELVDLLNRPAIKQAMQRANILAENQGRAPVFTAGKAATSGPQIVDESGNVLLDLGQKATAGKVSGQGLQDLKMALDEMLTDPASGFTGKAGATLKDLRKQIIGWMEKANPEFKAAREGYAAASKPLNQMDAARELLNRGASSTSDLAGTRRLMPGQLTRAVQDGGESVVQAGTGRDGLGGFSNVFDNNQNALIRAIVDEVDRAGAVARAGNGPGSATAQRMAAQNVLRQIVGPTGLPQSWAESAIANTVVGKPLNLLYGGIAEPKIQQALAEAVLDPAKARAAVQAAQAQGIKLPQNALTELLMQAARTTPSTLAVTGQR